jgi:tetratricopeptide (TPR) repeat protein
MAKQKADKKINPQILETQKVAKPKRNLFLWIGIIILSTFICYLPVLSDQKEFTNWDDPGYVTDQPLVKSLNFENVKKIFSPGSVVMFNYHPLTVLSLAIDYNRGYDSETNALSIVPFATTNLMLHLLNTALVFIFLYQLSRKKLWVAVVSALIFGIHPMHVESVAWISGRKDLLYCCFFLGSCITYLRYVEINKKSLLALSLLFFIASCLSKAMAVPLPIILFLIDFLRRRKLTLYTILEKVPFFIIAFIIGYYAVVTQKGAIAEYGVLTTWERLCYASYGCYMYLVKLIVPIHLSAYYPYPFKNSGSSLIYNISPLIALAVFSIPMIIYAADKERRCFRESIWGLGTYFAMIVLVLQFVSVGHVIMAERYSYVAYIGPLFLLSSYTNSYFESVKFKKIAYGILALFFLIYGYLTFNRVQVWQNSRALWEDVIEQYEKNREDIIRLKTPYKNLAEYYTSIKEFDSAYVYYSFLVPTGTRDAEVWSNLGNIYMLRNDLKNALKSYSLSASLDSSNYETFIKRGVVYGKLDKDLEAIQDFKHVIRLNPDFEDTYPMLLKQMLKIERYEEAVGLSEAAISKFPKNAELWFLKGVALVGLKKYEDGIKNIQQAMAINPKAAGLYYYNIASAYAKSGQNAFALKNAQQAKQLGFPISKDFIQKISK